nr:hypothetical protein [Desulfobacterales bacterium]
MRTKRERKAPKEPTKVSRPKGSIIDSRWFPPLLLLALTFIYFGTFLISDVAILGTDHDPRVFFHKASAKDLAYCIHPPNWSRNLGGMAVSDRRVGERYFPLIVFRYLMPFYKSLGWYYILITFGAGFFMFLYLRSLKVRREFALLIGICYMFAPTFLSFTFAGHYAKMEVIALTPLLFLAVEKGMETRKLGYFLLLSGAAALAIYTDHLQMAYFAFWGTGFYALFKLWETFKRERKAGNVFKRGMMFTLAFALGVGIGAMNLFPPYLHTTTVSKRAGGTSPEYAASWALHPEEMGSLIVPEFGNHLKYYWGRNFFKLNSEYMGIIPLLLAIIALFGVKKSPHFWFFLFLFSFATLFSLGPHTPLHKLFYLYVPGVKSLRAPGMIAFLFLLATSGMAASGLERLASMKGGRESSKAIKAIILVGVVGIAGALVISIVPRSFFKLWTTVLYSDITAQKWRTLTANLPNVRKGLLLFCLFLPASLALVYARLKAKINDLHLLLLTIPLVLIDTWRVDKQFLNYVDPHLYRRNLRAEEKLADFFRKDSADFRVLALFGDSRFRLKGVNMVVYFDDFMNKRYYEITRPQNLNSFNIINLLNAKYLIFKERLQIPPLEGVYAQDGFFVYKNPRAYPYFYLVGKYVVEQDPQEVLRKLKDPTFDSERTVVLEEEPGVELEGLSIESVSGERIEKLVYDDTSGYIKLKVSCGGRRFLVVSENYNPNWSAYVDGKKTKIFRANYVWKGVFLEPGEHIVEFKYFSKIASACRWASFASLFVFGAAVVLILTIGKGHGISGDQED